MLLNECNLLFKIVAIGNDHELSRMASIFLSDAFDAREDAI